MATAQWFGQSPFIFLQVLHSKNISSYKAWQEFYTEGRKEVQEEPYVSQGREETKTSHREVYIFKMYLFYQPHACKSNIPSKTFCRQRYSGNILEAAYLSAGIIRLARRDEYQMLSPAEMTACLPATSMPGHSYFMPPNTPCLALPNCLCLTGPVRVFQSAQVTTDVQEPSICSTCSVPSLGSVN